MKSLKNLAPSWTRTKYKYPKGVQKPRESKYPWYVQRGYNFLMQPYIYRRAFSEEGYKSCLKGLPPIPKNSDNYRVIGRHDPSNSRYRFIMILNGVEVSEKYWIKLSYLDCENCHKLAMISDRVNNMLDEPVWFSNQPDTFRIEINSMGDCEKLWFIPILNGVEVPKNEWFRLFKSDTTKDEYSDERRSFIRLAKYLNKVLQN